MMDSKIIFLGLGCWDDCVLDCRGGALIESCLASSDGIFGLYGRMPFSEDRGVPRGTMNRIAADSRRE